jgi:hypothetical protein
MYCLRILDVQKYSTHPFVDIYTDIEKQDAGCVEEKFALWMNQQLKKMAGIDFYLKLRDVPQQVKGFRLNPEHYRDDTDLEDPR